ncbi:3-dehydroquinate synthase [Dysgonomonas sp. PH5-45]|uniref:3-dehydroquinate synthase n=1 Tax=unclassified Dysgonomonas TaxID=2630389 RepID=UPI0024767A83|nr:MULTISPECIES: 3-dehydroquinate synthase [unclassified Dysgonomonas]MDH6354396.1 3-dehydroquinate synthase [Dysgonomonas sp. PH5-45]MDH6387295.1 3-dehydroquinate synthase [Dysgonomonas sp. PH5-37]
MQRIIKSENIQKDLKALLATIPYDKIFVLTDQNTQKLCLPLIEGVEEIREAEQISIPADDDNKTLDTLTQIWQYLTQNNATRHSLMINLGGGMVSDIGGFAAACFKRGIRYVNIPTTLLGAVDAAIGGKTGVNFGGLKNEIGAFYPPKATLIEGNFYKTLEHKEILSGYAEMIKHGLVSDKKTWAKLLNFNIYDIDYPLLSDLILESVIVKEKIVEQDPLEENIRKTLNLGHTTGHAFESLALRMGQPVPHGYAVAWGLVCELYLSTKQCGFPKDKFLQTMYFIKENYGTFPFSCKEYDALFDLMKHDKKNKTADKINFTLLQDIGIAQTDQTSNKEEIYESFDFLRESMGM